MTTAAETFLVLLAEDEALVAEVLEVALAEAGFTLVRASNGDKAIAELDLDATRFRAVITDIRLGSGLDGWDVGRRARELIPDIPLIYMSGDSGFDWSSKGVPLSVMLTKPFLPTQAILALTTLLNEADARRALTDKPVDG